MKKLEKVSFAETAFKRLYWSGYRGSFGLFSWPTGWFNKPANEYGEFELINNLVGNHENYNRSEAVARRVGRDLSGIVDQFRDASRPNITPESRHLIAHSMGNVVASEALRNYSGTQKLFESYSPSEAAEVAGAYSNSILDIDSHTITALVKATNCPFYGEEIINPVSFEVAWKCYNDFDPRYEDFQIPPDIYRYDYALRLNGEPVLDIDNNIILQHGTTSGVNMDVRENTQAYYSGISSKVNRIINYNNPSDNALSGWELNQFFKPRWGSWRYSNEIVEAYNAYEACLNDPGTSAEQTQLCIEPIISPPETVNSVFLQNTNVPIFWSLFDNNNFLSNINMENNANILAHIIPARTKALGQMDSINLEKWSPVPMGLTSSNQDHSAQFYGHISETRKDITIRANYWDSIIKRSLESGSNVSGLGYK